MVPPLRLPLPRLRPHSLRPFTTTTTACATPTPGEQRTRKQVIRIKKSSAQEGPRKPIFAEGERKALRNRIVLSNTNAPRLLLPEYNPETLAAKNIGKVHALRQDDIDKLRALDAFRRQQQWKLFSWPATVVRRQTVELGKALEGVEKESGMRRAVLHGPRGSGKSVLLLQAMCRALQKGWVVICVSEAQELTIAHTEYEYDATTKLWTHPEYTKTLLSRTATANRPVLQKLMLSQAASLGRRIIQPGTTLLELCQIGLADAEVANEIFNILVSELCAKVEGRPPVLFVLDNFSQISLPSAYRDPDFKLIHAHDFAIPHMFISFLSGKREFAKGGMALAATSSMCSRTEALEYALRVEDLPPYSKLDVRIRPSIEGAELMKVEGMEKEEARGLAEYCKDSGVSNLQYIDNVKLSEIIALSAGLPKEIIAASIRLK